MKKNFSLILALVATVSFVSCTKAEIDAPLQQISFQAASYSNMTRAAVGGVFSTANTFNTYAYYYTTGYDVQTFMNNQQVAYSQTESAWAPSRVYYWPKTGYINFISYCATNNNNPVVAEGSFKWNNVTVAADDDLMYADEAYGYTKNEDHVSDGVNTFTGVPTLFHHALCKVEFVAKTSQVSDGQGTTWKISIDSATLKNINKTGSLEMTSSEPASTPAIASWSLPTSTNIVGWTATSATENVTMGTVDSLGLTESSLLAARAFLPQTLASQKIVVKYTIATKYEGVQYSKETIEVEADLKDFKTASNTSLSAWGMNKYIKYTVNVNPATNKITFDPAVVDWDTVDGGSFAF